MFLADRLTLDAPKRTKDGYMAVRARVARTGLYDYAGYEVDPENKHGLRDKAVVKVFRPGDEVFNRESIHSFIGKPITNDHPREGVTADNWRDHARGTIMGAVRDGEHVAFDLLLTDKEAIAAVDSGKRELSNGYATDLDFTPGTHDGIAYDAVQRSIRGNHVALVDRGRAGSSCAIKDGLPVCDAITADKLDRLKASLTNDRKDGTMPHTLIVDGLQVPNVSDEAKACIEKLQGQLKDTAEAKDKALADVATLTTEKQQLDAKVTTLEKQVADAKITPQQMRDAAKAYAQVCDKAKALGVTVSDEMDEPAIMKAAVSAKIGDAAKDWNDAQIAASFATLTADVKAGATVPHGIIQPLATDAAGIEAKAFEDSVSNLNAWRDKRDAAAA
ncbi:DUF2213 domain-containing protein [Pelagerythrobacter aerophilus]|uniref:DUF2213 domain-containing protein n=1 Tax=Pelagerythrobacter aerophilus TaxID=2306995 RepID=A0A418NJQ9_9SPHN|nr:DUF2213 domain-containing protein [Pelagerythrobacter aerophilus]RIV79568.1 DUF2213 domain-containing protein [Pelagerythrobacter aerophilus]